MIIHIRPKPGCITASRSTRDIMAAIGTVTTGMRETGGVTGNVSKTAGPAIMTVAVTPADINVTAIDTCHDCPVRFFRPGH